ncbi:MAG: hypothetical protein HXS54_14310 [Theionarchaea archaeon]|nr:hypothetical protein [Theionarchaea archaeon]
MYDTSIRDLCFINIAGGTATDSINTLILILKENQSLLKDRKIEMCIFDNDTWGPGFADQGISQISVKKKRMHNNVCMNSLYDYSPDDMQVIGDTFHDLDTVDPTIPAVKEVCGMSFRFLGIEGLNRIVDETNWKLDFILEKNPIYMIFTLKKDVK